VTAGVHCRVLIDDPGNLDPKGARLLPDVDTHVDCAWPNRLQLFINNVIGDDVVEVTNAAVRATDSSIGKIVLEKYPMSDRPDIIINAYSTNDAMQENPFEFLQEFVRYVLRDEQCQTPLLVRFSDIMLPSRARIVAVHSFEQMVQTLASYYGFGSVSYSVCLEI